MLDSLVNMSKKPNILSVKTVAETEIFHIESLDLEFSNGERRQFERLSPFQRQAVMMVPVLEDNTLLLVREYAAGIEDYALGFPKGLADHNEPPEVAANRELMEEIGYGAKDIQLLTTLTLSPAYMKHSMIVYLVRDLFEQKLEGDEPEPLEIVRCPLADIDKMIQRADFTEARSIAALFMARQYLVDN